MKSCYIILLSKRSIAKFALNKYLRVTFEDHFFYSIFDAKKAVYIGEYINDIQFAANDKK